jgi:hypothetical protein
MPQRKSLNQLMQERSDAVNQYINIISKSWFKESFHTQITSYLFDIIKESCNYFNEQGQESNFSITAIEFPNNSFLEFVENKYLKYQYFHEEREVPDDNISLRNQVIQKISENINIIRLKIIRGNDACLGDNHYRQENKAIFHYLEENDTNLFDYLVDRNKSLKDIKKIRALASQDQKTPAPALTKKAAATIDNISQENKVESETKSSKKRGAEAITGNKNPIVKKVKLNEEESNSEGKETPSITPNTNSATPINDNSQEERNSQIG